MEEDFVNLVRRRSGGGAVYQDLGNSIFTFLSPKNRYDKLLNFKILQNALREEFFIESEVSGRNDLIEKNSGRKISGSAFKQGKEIAFHHGTILVNLDLNSLQKYLTPHKLKLMSKGVSSISSRVLNLNELNKNLNHENLCNALMKHFTIQYAPHLINSFYNLNYSEERNLKLFKMNEWIEMLKNLNILTFLNEDNLKQELQNLNNSNTLNNNSTLNNNTNFQLWNKFYNELNDNEWNYGKTPDFTYNIETRLEGFGMIDLHLDYKNGKIFKVKMFSDTLYPILVDCIEEGLERREFSKKGILEFEKWMLCEKLPNLVALANKKVANGNNGGIDEETKELLEKYVKDIVAWMNVALFE
ncbi:hypothetical protein ABK040_002527 [Willaertia magna]